MEQRKGRLQESKGDDYKLWSTDIPLREFWRAVRTNDHARLEELCHGKRLPTFSDKRSENHLLEHAMGQSADTKVLQFLVDHGVDPHAMPKGSHYSPLDRAISTGRLDYVDFVLGLGVDPNSKLVDHRVTLSAAGSTHEPARQIELLKRLIKRGVNLNFEFPLFGDMNHRFTVLDHAQHEEVRALLRSHGAKSAKELSGKSLPEGASRNIPHLDEVIAHMEELFGKAEQRSFTDILKAGSGVTLHVIPPQAGNKFITLFTTGLSLTRMDVPHNSPCSGYGELYMQLPSDWDLHGKDSSRKWPVQLLLDLASYPTPSNGAGPARPPFWWALGWGPVLRFIFRIPATKPTQPGAYFEAPVTVISNGKPLHPSVRFTSTALLALKDFERSDGKTVHLFCVLPVDEAEADMARQHIPSFLKALDRAKVGQVFSPDRKSVAGR